MATVEITKYILPIERLQAMDGDTRSAYLLIGLFFNEANWLQKLLLKAIPGTDQSEPELQAKISLCAMLMKTLAAKVHEGCARLRTAHIAQVIASLDLPAAALDAKNALEAVTQKGSVIYNVRNFSASHYPTEWSIEVVPSQEELAIYLTEHGGDFLSLLSDIAALEQLPKTTGYDVADFHNGFDTLIGDILDSSMRYTDYLAYLIKAFIDAPHTQTELSTVIVKEDAIAGMHFYGSPPEYVVGEPPHQ